MESNILLVDDNPGMIRLMGNILSSMGQLRFATSGAAALQQARELPPDLVLLDAEMPGMSGYEVCEAIKEDPALRDVPVIFVTANSNLEFELRGLGAGAVDFIAKPISEPLLKARVGTHLKIKKLTDELRRLASIDSLTEVYNRRSFDEALEREWQRGMRYGDPISMLLIDVDHFKLFNDRYGHPPGDGCLRAVAQALRSAILRPADFVFRYGGEEFAVLLPKTPRAGAEHLAQRVLNTVGSLGIPHEVSPTAPHVTVSIGIGCYDESSRYWAQSPHCASNSSGMRCRPSDLLQSADKALYAAKRGGRAQAWRLDICEVDSPDKARKIAASDQTSGRRAAS